MWLYLPSAVDTAPTAHSDNNPMILYQCLECEQTFSSSGRLIHPYRMSLGDDIIEALKCLKSWRMRDIIIHEQAR
jgi:hypothetical protein